MKLSKLVGDREKLKRQMYLADLAYSYQTVCRAAERIARARLKGLVHLRQTANQEDGYDVSLVAVELSQSLIEEHFTDREICEVADAIAFARSEHEVNVQFAIEDLREMYGAPLRALLHKAGVEIDGESQACDRSRPRSSSQRE